MSCGGRNHAGSSAHGGPALAGSGALAALADVPTALFVRNPTADSAWLPRLAPEVERFVFDSSRLPSGEGLAAVEQLLRRLFRQDAAGALANIDVVDMGWLRLWPWRILVASLFDSPDATRALRDVSEITIHHAAGAEPAALLLAGWLCSRLHLRWQATRAALYTLSGQSGHPVRLRIQEEQVADAPAGIERVELRCGSHTFAARLQGRESLHRALQSAATGARPAGAQPSRRRAYGGGNGCWRARSVDV